MPTIETLSEIIPNNIPIIWGADHQIFFSNAFQLRISDSDMLIELGTTQDINGTVSIYSTHQLALTPKSAKLLSIILANAVKQMEDRFGPIDVDPKKLEPLMQVNPDNKPPNG